MDGSIGIAVSLTLGGRWKTAWSLLLGRSDLKIEVPVTKLIDALAEANNREKSIQQELEFNDDNS